MPHDFIAQQPQPEDPAIPLCLHPTALARGRCCGAFGSMAFMRSQAPVIIAALITLLLAGCSKPSAVLPTLKVKDLGIVKVSDEVPIYHDLGASRGCVITPATLKSNSVRLAITIQETNSAGVVQTVAMTRVDIKAGKTNQISIGDNFDIRLMPQIEP